LHDEQEKSLELLQLDSYQFTLKTNGRLLSYGSPKKLLREMIMARTLVLAIDSKGFGLTVF
jgi:hypothetical protein